MVDLVTVEVIKGGLIYASEEMGIALRNSSYSHNIKERLDHSCAIFDVDTNLIAQAEHIPVHLGSMGLAVKQGLKEYKGELQQGDMILFNDPYISGTHLPDITFIAPVFYQDKIIAYVANKAHHSDVGGRAPGSLAGDSTELYQEGIIIPPVKFVKKGVFDQEILEIIKFNVRVPETRVGDLRAQAAAINVGITRILSLISKYGLETFEESIKEILNYSERRMRTEIEKMPEGVYTSEDYLESTGGIEDKPVKIMATITVKGSNLIFDYTGTEHQVSGPLNAPLGVTMSGVYYTLMAVTDPTIPVNDGCYRPIILKVPSGCLMNPIRPAPVAGGNVETSQRNVDVLLKAFAKIIPDKVSAGSQGTMNNVCVGGTDENYRPWAFYETIAGGMGGRPGLDGIDGIHVHMTNTLNTPIEALEQSYPLRFISYRMRADSGGPGKWRGGCGVERSWMLTSSIATLSILAERNIISPWGLKHGKPGAKGEFYIGKNRERERLKSKCTVSIEKGDIFITRTPGGGGYGTPLDRNPEAVLSDVLDDLISEESAREHYGVVIRRNKLDLGETMKLREEKRKERVQIPK